MDAKSVILMAESFKDNIYHDSLCYYKFYTVSSCLLTLKMSGLVVQIQLSEMPCLKDIATIIWQGAKVRSSATAQSTIISKSF